MKLFSLLTSEDSHSPAMKQTKTKHICDVNNLVEEISDVVKNKEE